jgi:hypothetical protein
MKFKCEETKHPTKPFQWVLYSDSGKEHIRSKDFFSVDDARKHAFQTMYFLFHKSAPLPHNTGVSTLKFDNEDECQSMLFELVGEEIAAIDGKFFDPDHVKKELAKKDKQ